MKKMLHALSIFGFCLLAVSACSGSQGGLSSAPKKNSLSSEPEKNSESRLVQYLNQALDSTSKSVRVNYYIQHPCSSDTSEFISFPRMDLHEPEDGAIGIAGIRSIFRSYPNVVVQKFGKKLLKVNIGSSTGRILETNIKPFKFRKFTRYNPHFAISAILGANEVQASARAEGIVIPAAIVTGFINPPMSKMPNLPHLPSELNNITLDEALSRVAETFNGVVVYSICKGKSGNSAMQVYFHSLKSKSLKTVTGVLSE